MLEVGRTPWSAADALVGLLVFSLDLEVRVQADQGVRPTSCRSLHSLGFPE